MGAYDWKWKVDMDQVASMTVKHPTQMHYARMPNARYPQDQKHMRYNLDFARLSPVLQRNETSDCPARSPLSTGTQSSYEEEEEEEEEVVLQDYC